MLFGALMALVALAPLPLAGNRPWAWTLMAGLVGLLLAAWAAAAWMGRARLDVPAGRLRRPAALFALALAWAATQGFGMVTPQSWQHPLWGEAAAALDADGIGAVSLAPDLTRHAILRWLSYAGVFFLAVQLGRERGRAHRGLVAVALISLAYALYGLAVYFSGSDVILWLDKWAYRGDLTATFVNRNSYGAYAGLGVVAACALFVFALRPRRPGKVPDGAHSLAERILIRALPWLMVTLVVGTAMLLSHSRGAFLSTGAAVVALMGGMVVCGAARARNGVVIVVVLLVVGLGVMGVSGEATIGRLAKTSLADSDDGARAAVYALVLNAIADAPLGGYGLGAFPSSFGIYRDPSLISVEVWRYAHNVHLELALDLGLPAAAALYAALLTVLLSCLRGIVRRRRDQLYPIVAVAAALLLGLHGLVDFSIQMPAVALTFAFLLGIGYAQSWNTAKRRRDEDEAGGPVPA